MEGRRRRRWWEKEMKRERDRRTGDGGREIDGRRRGRERS